MNCRGTEIGQLPNTVGAARKRKKERKTERKKDRRKDRYPAKDVVRTE